MKKKLYYFSPESDEIALSMERVIAQSGTKAPDFGDGGDLDELLA